MIRGEELSRFQGHMSELSMRAASRDDGWWPSTEAWKASTENPIGQRMRWPVSIDGGFLCLAVQLWVGRCRWFHVHSTGYTTSNLWARRPPSAMTGSNQTYAMATDKNATYREAWACLQIDAQELLVIPPTTSHTIQSTMHPSKADVLWPAALAQGGRRSHPNDPLPRLAE